MPSFKVKVYYINKDTTERNRRGGGRTKKWNIKNGYQLKKNQTKNSILNHRGTNSATPAHSASRKSQSEAVLAQHEEGAELAPSNY